jgi:Tol biopolymer transport system component
MRKLGLVIIFMMMTTGYTSSQEVNSTSSVYFSDWSADGSTIAVATEAGLTIYNADFTIRSVWENRNPNRRQHFADLSPYGDQIIVGQQIWDTVTFQITLETPDYYLSAWSVDGAYLLAIPLTELGIVKISSTTGKILQSYLPTTYSINGPVWSPDNRYFIGSDNNRAIYVVDSNTGNPIRQLNYRNRIRGLAWHPDSNLFVFAEVVGEDPNNVSSLHIVNVISGELRELTTINGSVTQMLWSPDGNQLLVHVYDMIYVVDIMQMTTIDYRFPRFPVYIDYSPAGGQILLSFLTQSRYSQDNQVEHVDGAMHSNQSLFSGDLQMLVPLATLERFSEIAMACGAPISLSGIENPTTTQSDVIAQALSLESQVEALPDTAIPPGCRADLLAVAAALQAQ